MTILTILCLSYVVPFFLLSPLLRWTADRYKPAQAAVLTERHLSNLRALPVFNLLMFVAIILITAIGEISILLDRLRHSKNDQP